MDFCGFVADSMKWAKIIYNNKNFIYKLDDDKKVYLTFDDGPTLGITDWVLDILEEFHAKATFFMIGNNIAKNPRLLEKIIERGHSVGNHTYNHLKGFNVDTNIYVKDVIETQKLLPDNKKLFRPPYGRIKNSQAKKLIDLGFRIVMWSIISCDYERKIDGQRVFNLIKKRISPGAIIVFHDSLKAEKNMKYALKKVLEEYSEIYEFAPILL